MTERDEFIEMAADIRRSLREAGKSLAKYPACWAPFVLFLIRQIEFEARRRNIDPEEFQHAMDEIRKTLNR